VRDVDHDPGRRGEPEDPEARPAVQAETEGDEAFEVANSTRYGLAASLFTDNRHLAHEFIQRMESGMVHINHGTASQAHVPFGGVKDSGQGAFSIGPTVKDAFTNVKTVYIKW